MIEPQTRLVHADGGALPQERPTVGPIHVSTTYVSPDLDTLDRIMGGTLSGYAYSRQQNPTVHALEAALAQLEGGAFALATASGMAAIAVVMEALAFQPGDVLLTARELYGTTLALFGRWQVDRRMVLVSVDVADEPAWAEAVDRYRPRAIYVESSSNPLCRVADIPRLARLAARVHCPLIVDNTFCSPWLARPLELGADLVVESVTKFVAGHGDVTGGVVSGKDPTVQARLASIRTVTGGVMGPFDAYLALRGLKTLGLRLERQVDNASRIAEHFQSQGLRVWYPGLPSHPDHGVANRDWSHGFGAMLSMELPGGRMQVDRLFQRVRIWRPATSLGDVASLVLYPAVASHRSLSEAQRHQLGITDGMIRLSVGIEAIGDLIADLEQALGSG